MTGKLDGRRIVITGAASGMGRDIARLFAQEGAKLALLDHNEAGAGEVAAELSVTAYGCDVSDRAQVDSVVAKAGAVLGGIDGVVNAAGILVTKVFDELDPESWDRMLAKTARYAPEFVAEHGPSARAYQLRYLARRSIQMGDPAFALHLLKDAAKFSWRPLLDEPVKTLETWAAALAARSVSPSLIARLTAFWTKGKATT